MELVGRLEAHMGKADMDEVLADCREAAACIREMVEKIAMLEDELEVANLYPAPGAEDE